MFKDNVSYIIYALYYSGMGLTIPFISWHFYELSGNSFIATAFLIAIPYFFTLVTSFIYGIITDLFGSKKVIIFTLSCYMLSFVYYYLVTDSLYFFIGYIVFTLLFSGFVSAFQRLRSLQEQDNKEKEFGNLGSIASLGFLSGSFLAGLLIDNIGLLPLFLIAMVTSLVAILLAFALEDVKIDDTEESSTIVNFDGKNGSNNNYLLTLILILGIVVTINFTSTIYSQFFSIFLENEVEGGSVGLLAKANTIATLIGLVVSQTIGRIMNSKNSVLLLISSLLLYIGIPLIIYYSDNVVPIFIVYCIPAYAVSIVVMPVLLSQRASPKNRGKVMGAYTSAQYIGSTLGVLAGGFLAEINQVILPNFLLSAFVAFIGLLLGILLKVKIDREKIINGENNNGYLS